MRVESTLFGNGVIAHLNFSFTFNPTDTDKSEGSCSVRPLTLEWSVMLQMVMTVSLANRKSSVTFSPRATEQRVSRLLRTTSLSALLVGRTHTHKHLSNSGGVLGNESFIYSFLYDQAEHQRPQLEQA